jgi:hypothetical protein
MFHKSLIVGVSLLCVLAVCGCRRNSTPHSTVSGTVSYHGAPLPGGTLYLFAGTGNVPPYMVFIKPDGTFAGNAPPPGQYRVVVWNEHLRFFDVSRLPPQYAKAAADTAGKMGTYVPLPTRYRSSVESGLMVAIHEGSNEERIDLH